MTRGRMSDTGEHAWIARLLRRLPAGDRHVLVGPGDDAAVVRAAGAPLAITTDTLVEGVHFRRDWCTARALGQRAFRSNASDIAAMGGRPWQALVNLIVPPSVRTRWLDALMTGFATDARAAGASVIGGNVARGPVLAIAVTMLGLVPGRPLTRDGARPGDVIWLTGTVGGTGWAVRERLAGRAVRLPALPRRWDFAARAAPLLHAAIDVSDGLVQDAGHIARAAQVTLDLDRDRVPVAARCRIGLGARARDFALGAGEDYELLLTAPETARARLSTIARTLGCRLTPVGRVRAGKPIVRVLDAAGRPQRLDAGFDHFRGRP